MCPSIKKIGSLWAISELRVQLGKKKVHHHHAFPFRIFKTSIWTNKFWQQISVFNCCGFEQERGHHGLRLQLIGQIYVLQSRVNNQLNSAQTQYKQDYGTKDRRTSTLKAHPDGLYWHIADSHYKRCSRQVTGRNQFQQFNDQSNTTVPNRLRTIKFTDCRRRKHPCYKIDWWCEGYILSLPRIWAPIE